MKYDTVVQQALRPCKLFELPSCNATVTLAMSAVITQLKCKPCEPACQRVITLNLWAIVLKLNSWDPFASYEFQSLWLYMFKCNNESCIFITKATAFISFLEIFSVVSFSVSMILFLWDLVAEILCPIYKFP